MSPTTIAGKPDEKNVEVAWTPSTCARIPGGIAVAALMAAMMGMLTLAMVNVFTAGSKAFKNRARGLA